MIRVAATSSAKGTPDLSSRDFDYGVGDDFHNAVEQLRAEIAADIRKAASLDLGATREDRAVYERAARIAEAGPDHAGGPLGTSYRW